MANERPKSKEEAPRVYVVRADDGRHAKAFRKGNYAGIGFLDVDFSKIPEDGRDQLKAIYVDMRPEESPYSIGQQVGQIMTFLMEVAPNTYVVTPTRDSSKLMVGRVTGEYRYVPGKHDSPYPHRRPVEWFDRILRRDTLSVPAQRTLSRPPTVFEVPQKDEILAPYGIDVPEPVRKAAITQETLHRLVLDQLLELSAGEFEILVTELLAAIGFEARHVGQVGDGGVDVEGILRVYDFASVDLKVQVKRYASGYIGPKAIKDFRSSVPLQWQASFVTTSDYSSKAREEAEKTGFKKIGLINGKQLVGILIEHYDALPPELQDKLGLQKTLIPKT